MKRSGTAQWNGTGKDGKGHLTSQSGVLKKTQYSYSSRFEDGIGTNPEELIAAAHAGCFTMKLSFLLSGAGYTPDSLETKCQISLVNGAVVSSELTLNAMVEGISDAEFETHVRDAEKNCPISKLFNTEISVTYTLNVTV